MNQTVHAAYGFSVPPEQIDDFLTTLVGAFGKTETLTGEELEDFNAVPQMDYLTDDPKWSNLRLSSNYDENKGVRILVVYDNRWSQRVSSRWETVLPVSLQNPADYTGQLEALSLLWRPEGSLSWVFYAVVN